LAARILTGLLALTIALGSCGNDKGSNQSGHSSGASTSSPAAGAGNGFNLGGVYRVDLHYSNFSFRPDCHPSAGSMVPFDLSYRASASGSRVAFRSLDGRTFDLAGAAQPDGTLSLSGSRQAVPGFHESGTLKGRWSPPHLEFVADIVYAITPAEGPKQGCTFKAKAAGTATPISDGSSA